MNHNFEKQLVFHVSPTILKIKAASLLNYRISDNEDFKATLKIYREYFNQHNLKIKVFCMCKTRALLYIYNEDQLKQLLKKNINLLQEHGYSKEYNLDSMLNHLARKINMQKDFPHEIGIFLDYPLKDVKGFIENAGSNFKICGYWKVYDDIPKALSIFEKYEQAQAYLFNLVQNHKSILNIGNYNI